MKKRIGMNVHFAEPPHLGLALLFGGQRYDLVEKERSKLTWASKCRVCNAAFTATTGLEVSYFTRTCPEHRARSYAQLKPGEG